MQNQHAGSVTAIVFAQHQAPRIMAADVGSCQDAKSFLAGHGKPVVIVLRGADLEAFARFPGLGLHDCGDQASGRQLYRYALPGRSFMLRCRYRRPGDLRNAIDDLLTRSTGDSGSVCLISVLDDDVFDALHDRVTAEIAQGQDPLATARAAIAERIIGASAGMRKLREEILDAATRSDSPPTLIVGETGTGKTLIAQTLHAASEKHLGPFVKVDCPALVPRLYQPELHGVRANYPGFHNEEELVGKLEQADGGALFLDEIGDLDREVQARLLADVEEKVVKGMGKAPKKVDFWLVCATDQDLRDMRGRGEFRNQLYYRIAHCQITTPSLREVATDIPVLVKHFWRDALDGMDERKRRSCFPTPPPRLLAEMSGYGWPGNVRDLMRAVRELVRTQAGRGPGALVERFRGMLEQWVEEPAPAWGEGLGGLPALEQVRDALDTVEDAVTRVLADKTDDAGSRTRLAAMLEGRLRTFEILREARPLIAHAPTREAMASVSSALQRLSAASLAQRTTGAQALPHGNVAKALADAQSVIEARIDEAASVVHDVYLKVKEQLTGERDPRSYRQLPPDLQASNRAQFLNMPGIFGTCGLRMRPARRDEIVCPVLTTEEVESMARLEHERWCRERTAADWEYALVKDEAEKKSPYLVPWNKLDDAVKEYSRIAVRGFPEILRALGIELYRPLS